MGQLTLSFAERQRSIQERFEAFHARNPHVFEGLRRLARRLEARPLGRVVREKPMAAICWCGSCGCEIRENYGTDDYVLCYRCWLAEHGLEDDDED